MDFQLARENMVHSQVRPSDVTNRRLSTAMLNIRREAFVPPEKATFAYSDEEIPLATSEGYPHKRYMMAPMPLAKLVQLAAIKPTDVVLEIGCGTGYGSALISRLCESVIALEEDETLANAANEILTREGFDNVAVVTGPLNEGLANQGPYDVIFIGGLVEEIPSDIFNQLKENGRLVAVVGSGPTASACSFIRTGETFSQHRDFSTSVAPLPGFAKKAEFIF